MSAGMNTRIECARRYGVFRMIEGKTEAYAEAAPEEERGPQKPQKLSGRA